MRKLLASLLLLAAFQAQAYTYVGGAQVSSSGSATSISISHTCAAVGNLEVLFAIYFHHSAVTITPTNTDGFTWSNVISSDNPSSYGGVRVYYAVCSSTSSDTITVSFSGSGVTYPTGAVVEYSGLTGTPYVTGEYAFADHSTSTGNYSGANSNSSGNTPTLSGNPDLLVGITYDTNGTSSTGLWSAGTGFTGRQTMQFEGSSGNVVGLVEDELLSSNSAVAATFTATTSASTVAPVTAAIVFHQTSGGTCTHTFYDSGGHFSTPNGSSGSYLTSTGSYATPNCSSGLYWRSDGTFSAN